METKSSNKEQCKIRKRGNSSSSSSSLIQKYRFKRAILVGKKGGSSSTPVPSWMTSATTMSPTLVMPIASAAESAPNCPLPQSGGTKHPKDHHQQVSVSARKLAATLWEINKIPSPSAFEDKKEVRSREKVSRLPHFSDPSYTPETELRIDRPKGHSHRRRASYSSKKLQLAEYNPGVYPAGNVTNLMEIENHPRRKPQTECVVGIRTRLKDVSNGLTTSKELLKVLNHMCGLEEKHSSSSSLVSALRMELDRARIQVNQLIKDQRSNRGEIEYLVKHFEEEKAAWRSKERDRIRNAIACVAEELEVERKMRRQTERLNKKLGQELAETKAALSKAVKELESEKRAKDILEQVCGELAQGIGDDRAEVEQLKRESAKVREEVEKEREMLHVADVLREERVQMKLADAKYHFEEKNAAVEKLRDELETYLKEKTGKENGDASPDHQRIKELQAYLEEIQFGSCREGHREGAEGAVGNGELHDEDDSADSDLHSIELSMDNNSKSYNWSYACDGDGPNNSVGNHKWFFPGEREVKARKSISENLQWESISLQRKDCNGNDGPGWGVIDKFSGEKVLGLHSQTQEYEDDLKRYKSAKSLKDHILSGTKRTSTQNFHSPTRLWGQSLPLQDSDSAVSEGSPVLQGEALKPRVVGGAKGER